MVSHNLFAVKAMCRRVLVLSSVGLQFDGSPAEGLDLYEKDSRLDPDPWSRGTIGEDIDKWAIFVRSIELLDTGNEPRSVYDYGEQMRARIHYEIRTPVKYPNFYLGLLRSDDIACCTFSSARDGFTVPLLEKSGMIELTTPPLRLVSSSYRTFIFVWDQDFKNLYSAQPGPPFHVRDEVLDQEFGVIHSPADWRWREMMIGNDSKDVAMSVG
jgi:lipopolysaccharide transport system ATP-binding protein